MLKIYKNELDKKGEIYLRVKVRPGSAKSEVKEIMSDGTIKINIKAPAVKGKANAELINYISKFFTTKKSNIKIISGVAEKLKLIKISR